MNPKKRLSNNSWHRQSQTIFETIQDRYSAIIDLDQAIKLNPQYTSAYKNRGKAFGTLGLHEKVLEDFFKGL